MLLSTGRDMLGTAVQVRTYVDHKNRPIAKFVEKGVADSVHELGAAEESGNSEAGANALMSLFGDSLGVGSNTFVLSGKIQRYSN